MKLQSIKVINVVSVSRIIKLICPLLLSNVFNNAPYSIVLASLDCFRISNNISDEVPFSLVISRETTVLQHKKISNISLFKLRHTTITQRYSTVFSWKMLESQILLKYSIISKATMSYRGKIALAKTADFSF